MTRALGILVLMLLSGCASFERLASPHLGPAAAAEARLAAGTLPDAVPPVPEDGALGVAQEHFRAGNFGHAARYFEQAVAVSPASAEAWLGLAAAYDRLRRFDLADEAYVEAAARAGATAAYHNNVGFSYLLRGRPDRARQSFRQALAVEPQNVTVLNNLELARSAGIPRAAGL